MYKKAYAEKTDKWGREFKIHLWDDEEGYDTYEYKRTAFKQCHASVAQCHGLSGEPLQEVEYFKNDDDDLHFHDMLPHQRFLINKYGVNDEISTGHKIVYFDIEIEIGGALTEAYIQSAPKPVTSYLFIRNL